MIKCEMSFDGTHFVVYLYEICLIFMEATVLDSVKPPLPLPPPPLPLPLSGVLLLQRYTGGNRLSASLIAVPFWGELYSLVVVVVSSLCSMANNICHASTTSIYLFLKTSGGHWPELSGQCSPLIHHHICYTRSQSLFSSPYKMTIIPWSWWLLKNLIFDWCSYVPHTFFPKLLFFFLLDT